jgi:hypothetical protein
VGSAEWLGATRKFVRNLLAREHLPPPDPTRRVPARRRARLARALFAIEALPVDPVPPPRAPRRGVLRSLFASEPLAVEPERPPRFRRRWLRWLVAPESIDGPSRR